MRGTCRTPPEQIQRYLPPLFLRWLAPAIDRQPRFPINKLPPRRDCAPLLASLGEEGQKKAKAANELVPKRRAQMRRLLLTSGGVSRASRHVEARCLFPHAARIVKYACAPLRARAEADAPLEVNRPGSREQVSRLAVLLLRSVRVAVWRYRWGQDRGWHTAGRRQRVDADVGQSTQSRPVGVFAQAHRGCRQSVFVLLPCHEKTQLR